MLGRGASGAGLRGALNDNRAMSRLTPSPWPVRLTTLALWALAAASAVFWGLRLSTPASLPAAPASPAAVAAAAGCAAQRRNGFGAACRRQPLHPGRPAGGPGRCQWRSLDRRGRPASQAVSCGQRGGWGSVSAEPGCACSQAGPCRCTSDTDPIGADEPIRSAGSTTVCCAEPGDSS